MPKQNADHVSGFLTTTRSADRIADRLELISLSIGLLIFFSYKKDLKSFFTYRDLFPQRRSATHGIQATSFSLRVHR